MAEFRRKFPLGSTTRVILLDDALRYVGIRQTAKAYLEAGDLDVAVGDLAESGMSPFPPR